MSQREKAGLSWPELPVSTGEPFEIRPETACSFNGLLFLSIVSSEARPSLQSRPAGVAQEASFAAPLRFNTGLS